MLKDYHKNVKRRDMGTGLQFLCEGEHGCKQWLYVEEKSSSNNSYCKQCDRARWKETRDAKRAVDPMYGRSAAERARYVARRGTPMVTREKPSQNYWLTEEQNRHQFRKEEIRRQEGRNTGVLDNTRTDRELYILRDLSQPLRLKFGSATNVKDRKLLTAETMYPDYDPVLIDRWVVPNVTKQDITALEDAARAALIDAGYARVPHKATGNLSEYHVCHMLDADQSGVYRAWRTIIEKAAKLNNGERHESIDSRLGSRWVSEHGQERLATLHDGND